MELLYKREKTEDDINKLVGMHKNLVYYCLAEANQTYNQDAESAAFEALWDAVNLFDIYAVSAFSTFACKVITNRIYTVLRDAKKREKNEIVTEDCTSFFTEAYVEDIEDTANKNYTKLCNQIDGYIVNQTDKIKSILVYWKMHDYNVSATEIAAKCSVSASYVSRVQLSFRVAIQNIQRANKKLNKS